MMKRGFTLIEVMVSMGIIVLILGVTLPAFTDFQKRQNLAASAESVRDIILEGQNYALAPRGASDNDPGKPAGADFYRVAFLQAPSTTSPFNYAVIEQGANGSSSTTPADATWDKIIRSGKLAPGVRFCSATTNMVLLADATLLSSPSGIVYSIARSGRIVSSTGTNDYGTYSVTLQHTGLTEGKTITVNASTGQVSIASVTNPSCTL